MTTKTATTTVTGPVKTGEVIRIKCDGKPWREYRVGPVISEDGTRRAEMKEFVR